MFCQRCGKQVAPENQFCPACGHALGNTSGLATVTIPAPADPIPDPIWTPPTGVHASGGRWIAEGWTLVRSDLGSYVLLSLLFVVLCSVPLIQGSLIAGFHIFTMKKLEGRNAEVGDLFTGFNYFVAALVASLLIALFTFTGSLFFVIPGLVVAAMYKFTYLFIVDKRMEFWPAMKASHAVVRNDYFGFTMFLILAFFVNVLGALCLVVGLLVTIPLTFAAITVAYKEIVGFDRSTVDSL
jgi:hypothetical protein